MCQYDAVLIPKNKYKRIKFWQKPPIDSAMTAVSFYMDWTCFHQKLAFIETDDVEKEARNKGSFIGSMISSFKCSKMLASKKVSDLDSLVIETVDKVF